MYYDFFALRDALNLYIPMACKKIIESNKTINHFVVCDVLCGCNPKTFVILKTSLAK